MAKGKIGRPTDNPKDFRISIKLDKESKEIIEKYCEQKQVSRMEAGRRGIKKLKDELE